MVAWHCEHDKCQAYPWCQEVPFPDCSGMWEPPDDGHQPTRVVYPVSHGPKCQGHREYAYGVYLREAPLALPSPGLAVKEEYL